LTHAFTFLAPQWSSTGLLAKRRVVTLVSALNDKPIANVEAELAKNRISELKEQEYNMQYQQLIFTHQQRQEEI
jgi:hypothetical protein